MGLFDLLKKKLSTPSILKSDFLDNDNISVEMNTNLQNCENEIIPVEVRIKKTIPSKHGLYPHEILALYYAHTFYIDNNEFQGFWWYQYGVKNVQKVLSSLIKRGFLKVGNLKMLLEKQTVAKLKEVLRDYEIKVTGKKEELVQRILDTIDVEELNERFPRRTYCLTDIGEETLEKEKYVPYIHRHFFNDIDIWLLNQLVNTGPDMSYQNKILEYLNMRSIEYLSHEDYGLYRNCRYDMYVVLRDGCRWNEVLPILSEIVFLDLSGVGNGCHSEFLNLFIDSYFPYKNSLLKLAPVVISAIAACQKEIGYSDNELRIFMIETMKKLNSPNYFFTVEECVQILFLEFDDDEPGLIKIYTKAEQRFKQNQ